MTNRVSLNPTRISTLHPAQARTILLEIPAEREQVLLMRSLTGHIAARTDLTLVDLCDLRLAVVEACGLFLLDARFDATGRTLRCRFEERLGLLRIQVSAPVPPDMRPDRHGVGWIMLDALVDEVFWYTADGVGTLTLVKRPWSVSCPWVTSPSRATRTPHSAGSARHRRTVDRAAVSRGDDALASANVRALRAVSPTHITCGTDRRRQGGRSHRWRASGRGQPTRLPAVDRARSS